MWGWVTGAQRRADTSVMDLLYRALGVITKLHKLIVPNLQETQLYKSSRPKRHFYTWSSHQDFFIYLNTIYWRCLYKCFYFYMFRLLWFSFENFQILPSPHNRPKRCCQALDSVHRMVTYYITLNLAALASFKLFRVQFDPHGKGPTIYHGTLAHPSRALRSSTEGFTRCTSDLF